MAKLKFMAPVSGLQTFGSAAPSLYEHYIAIEGQTLFPLQGSYDIGGHQLHVYRNGILQEVDQDYQETSSQSVTFSPPVRQNDSILFTVDGVYSSRLHEEYIATAGQAGFTLNKAYHVGEGTLLVFRNGILQRNQDHYLETDPYYVSFLVTLIEGDVITFHEQV